MAQALFDGHPMEHYLRESGEILEPMPGGYEAFSLNSLHDGAPCNFTVRRDWFPRLPHITQTISKFIGFRRSSAASEFAERFKYVVISSSLLSSSLSLSPINRATTPTTPGHFDQSKPSYPTVATTTNPTISSMTTQFFTLTLACLVPAAMGRGHYLSGLLILAAVKFLSDRDMDLPPTLAPLGEETWAKGLKALESLVEANNAWENIISEAFTTLDRECQTPLPGPSSSSRLSSLRSALSYSLHTTQRQCDNARQLLAALTSPLVLSQLSHMYAPPSPSRRSPSPKRARPNSLAVFSSSPADSHDDLELRTPSTSTPPGDSYSRARAAVITQAPLDYKRSTWSGSFGSPASGSRPPLPNRRPELSSTAGLEVPSSPTSPTFATSASSVQELNPTPSADDTASDADAEDEPFGVAALDLRRKRPTIRISTSKMPSPLERTPVLLLPNASLSRGSHGPALTASFGSRFTSLNTTSSTSRSPHPLSMSNLHLALQGAVGSKRFACAHLLALRFADPNSQAKTCKGSDVDSDVDGEDESYWEDVRSVISLLTSALEDVSTHLGEELAETARRTQERVVLTHHESHPNSAPMLRIDPNPRTKSTTVSFAPIPTPLTRFTAHIDAITSALDDARDHVRNCVAAFPQDAQDIRMDTHSSPLALQSYERLRKELGFALRECERGWRTLQDIVMQRSSPAHLDSGACDEESPIRNEEQLSSEESDKTLINPDEAHEPQLLQTGQEQDREPTTHQDDVAPDLPSTESSQHLPPPGIEQVFECVSGAPQPFFRQRSKLTREERIRLSKVRRENRSVDTFHSGAEEDVKQGEPLDAPPSERWGPSGEVVQELKDVIWKVSEHRRKTVERSTIASHRLPADCIIPTIP